MTSTPTLTTQAVFDDQREYLKLRWLAGQSGNQRPLERLDAKYPGLALVGYLSLIHANRVQVLGINEFDYLNGLDEDQRDDTLLRVVSADACAMLVAADDCTVPQALIDLANAHAMPILASSAPGPRLINALQYYLTNALAERVTLHGVFMEVMGIGVLLTGESGIGKSEVALELLSRNHRLISDDVVELSRVTPLLLEGRCPEALRDFMEVRGLGILDVRAMFGDTSTKNTKYLRLIVRLEQMGKSAMGQLDRLQADTQTRTILDVKVPEVVIPVAPGRNLAVLVEAAARNHIQQMHGYNALKDFMDQQQAVMQQHRQELESQTKKQ